MKRLMAFNLRCLPAFALALGFTACNIEPEPVDTRVELPESAVAFKLGQDNVLTKGGASIMDAGIDISEETGIDGLSILEEVSSLGSEYMPLTKGTPVFTENIADLYGEIAATAYQLSGTEKAGDAMADAAIFGGKDDIFTPKEGKVWYHDYGSGVVIPDNLLYFFKAPVFSGTDAPYSNLKYTYSGNPAVSGTSTDPLGYGKISFDYVSPGAVYPTSDMPVANAATLQKDLVFSSHLLEDKDDVESVLLYHVLTGVKFKLGEIVSGKMNITKIQSVTFNNLISEGSCVVLPNYDGYSDESNADGKKDKSSLVSKWTYDATPKRASFTQTFTENQQTTDLTKEGGSDLAFPDAWYAATANKGNNLNDPEASLTFMFIPQEITEDVTLDIVYDYVDALGNEVTGATATIDFGEKMIESLPTGTTTYEWKAGELRTYTLGVGDRVDVAITDEYVAASHTKSDLTITNTGTATTYMRVAVIGNWYSNEYEKDEFGEYVLDEDNEKILILGKGAITPYVMSADTKSKIYENITDWVEGPDGYFYYLNPVAGGHTICQANTLFEDEVVIIATQDPAPYANCHLELKFAVQSVRATEVAASWAPVSKNGDKFYVQPAGSGSPVEMSLEVDANDTI